MNIPDRLHAIVHTGLLLSGELRVALALSNRAGLEPTWATIVVAFAVRAPRCGQVCVLLPELLQELRSQPELAALTWPEPSIWDAALDGCSLLRDADELEKSAPLVRKGPRIYLDRYFRYVESVAQDLHQRARAIDLAPDPKRLQACLAQLYPAGDSGPELDRQLLATVIALLHRFSVISGGPGTGKTTTVTKLMAAMLMTQPPDAGPLRIALAAPTGKAAARMHASVAQGVAQLPISEDTRRALSDIPASTLHRLLGRRGDHSSRFRFDRSRPLPFDLVIVDEATMVSMAMMARLLEALPATSRLILLGDRDQLASVDAGAVFAECSRIEDEDLRCSEALMARIEQLCGFEWRSQLDVVAKPGLWDCSVQLTRYHRFASDSGIARWTRALRGMPKPDASSVRGEQLQSEVATIVADLAQRSDDGVELLAHQGGALPSALRSSVLEHFSRLVDGAFADRDVTALLAALDDTRVLAPHREGPLGVSAINRDLESRLLAGLDTPRRSQLRIEGGQAWYPGRPLMVTQNSYAVGLFNGDIGIVVRDPHHDNRLVAAFSPSAGDPAGTPRLISLSRLPPCESVYCMSIHKSQGSQFRHAIMVLPQQDSPILTRELIYTGLTRAREHATIVADQQLLSLALSRCVHRSSGLRERLWPPQ